MIRKRILPVILFAFALSSCAPKHIPRIIQLDEKDDYYYQFMHADILALKGETQKSTAELLKLTAKFPDLAFFHYLLAQNYAQDQKIASAIESCKRAVEISPQFMEARIFLGKLYASQKKDDEAVKIFAAVVREDQRQEDVYPFLITEYITLREYSKAIETAKQMLAINPDSVAAYFYLGSIYDENLRNTGEAIRMYQEALNIDPTNPNIYNVLGELHIRHKQYRKALAKFEELSRLEPDDITVKLRIALIHFELKEYNRAINVFNDIIAMNPDADKIRFYLGILYENTKQGQKAVAEFSAVPVNSGFYKDARIHMAALNRDAGKTEEAVAALRQAIEQRPQQPEFYEYLAALHEEMKNYPMAISVLKDGHAALPNEEKIAFLLGILYEKVKDREGAVSAMRGVLKINPQNASALNYIGYTYAEMGKNLDEALSLVEQALVLRPDDGYMTDSLGWVYFKMDDCERAVKYLTKAASLVPDEPTVYYHLGEALLKCGDPKKALKFFERAKASSAKKKEIDEEELVLIKQRIEELKAK